MKEGVGSGNFSARAENRRVSSKGEGAMKIGVSGKPKVFESKKEKKRRLILSDSESDKDLGSTRQKVDVGADQNAVGSVNLKKSSVDSLKPKEEIEVDRKKIRLDPVKNRERAIIDRKRSREEHEIVSKKIKMDSLKRREEKTEIKGNNRVLSPKLEAPTASQKREVGERECGKISVSNKRTVLNLPGNSGSVVERNRGTVLLKQARLRFDKDKKCFLSGATGEKVSVSPSKGIRIQGKNGVLRVMSSNKKVLGGSEKKLIRTEAKEDRKGSASTNISSCIMLRRPSLSGENKLLEKSSLPAKKVKNHVNLPKLSSISKNRVRDPKKEDVNISLQMEENNKVRGKGKNGSKSESIQSSKPNRALSTERQLLRDRIKNMLLSAGWTIDYIPRRDRDYKDAVYNSPDGIAYWSIVKAHFAFQKQLNCGDKPDDCSSLGNLKDKESPGKLPETSIGSDHQLNGATAPVSTIQTEELSILMRRTAKKIRRETAQKRREERINKNTKEATKMKSVKSKHLKENRSNPPNRDKLNSYNAHKGKSLKGELKENSFVALNAKGLVRNLKSSHISGKVDRGKKKFFLSKQGKSTSTSLKGTPRPDRAQKPSSASDVLLQQGKKDNKKRGTAILVRSSRKGLNLDTDNFVPYAGKLTVLSWLIDSGTMVVNGRVKYMNKRRTKSLLDGWITRDGILCSCCSKILTVSKFEIHAGSKLCQPFQYIFVETGVSLMQCQLDAWDKQEDSRCRGLHFVDVDGDDPNDDTCGLCGDGGDLICCDGCPSTFHQSCLGIQTLPPSDWHCPNCSCKFCGVAGGSTAKGDNLNVSPLLSCHQCEKKYHHGCIRETDVLPVDSNSLWTSFCGKHCREIFEQLQKLLGVKNELETGYSWTLIRRFGEDSKASLHGLPKRAECNSKLAIAQNVMDECFMPIIDRRSSINMIHNVLYNCGSNFNRMNYSGFYTVILEKGDEIISVASIRIHGTTLAEMPFIGTRHIYRRQGMCRRLLNAIESALCSLNVEKLIIPAISELIHTWTIVFGFKPLEELYRQEMKSMNLLVFPGTGLLQKILQQGDCPEGNATADLKAIELESNHCDAPEVENKSLPLHSDAGCSNKAEMENKSVLVSPVEPNLQSSDEGTLHDTKVKDEDGVENDLHCLGETSIDHTSEAINECSDALSGSNFQPSAENSFHCNSGWPEKLPESSSCASLLLSDVTHLDSPEVTDVSIVASPVGLYSHTSGEGAVHDSDEVRTEGAEPSKSNTHGENSVHSSSKITIQSLDATSAYNFQVPCESVVCHESEITMQSRGSVHDTYEVQEELGVVKHDTYALCEDSMHFASEVVRESLDAASESNCVASGELQ